MSFPNRPGVDGHAQFSECGEYRYALVKRWGDGPSLAAILLNPSTATADEDDPTVRRVVLRAQQMDFGSLIVLNVYAYRTTNPRELRLVADPVGPENDRLIAELVTTADKVLIGWGNRGESRAPEIFSILARVGVPVYRLGRPTRRGNPRHPLYLRKKTEFELVKPA